MKPFPPLAVSRNSMAVMLRVTVALNALIEEGVGPRRFL
jgi:hypothetical protein